MKINQRLDRLERSLGVAPPRCPECGGKGRFSVVIVEPGDPEPKGGCPKCGRGYLITITSNDSHPTLYAEGSPRGCPGGRRVA